MLLLPRNMSESLITETGRVYLNRDTQVEIFDDDAGFIKIEVPAGYYEYRILDFFGWRPVQLFVKLNYDGETEIGWLDFPYSDDFLDFDRIWEIKGDWFGMSIDIGLRMTRESAMSVLRAIRGNKQKEDIEITVFKGGKVVKTFRTKGE